MNHHEVCLKNMTETNKDTRALPFHFLQFCVFIKGQMGILTNLRLLSSLLRNSLSLMASSADLVGRVRSSGKSSDRSATPAILSSLADISSCFLISWSTLTNNWHNSRFVVPVKSQLF